MDEVTYADPTRDLARAEAEQRLRSGQGNTGGRGTSRSYAAILRANVFSFFNTVLFVIGLALLALGRYNDAFISVGLGIVNALIGAVQEMRAKRKLDALQLLDQAPQRVDRDAETVQVAPTEVVRGDVVLIGAGDQVVVDGPLLDGEVEVDESLLTGESDAVLKRVGDELRSGSVCVAGAGRMAARDVGGDSHAGRLTGDARRHTTDRTPLQRRVAFVVRLVIVLTLLMSGAILAQAFLEGFTLVRTVQITAVLSGLVPYGLFTLIAVAYTAGAVRISRDGALVQQVNAVESLASVDVVCTDKTGTLTTGRLSVAEVVPLGDRGLDEARSLLGAYAHRVTVPNLTSVALATALTGPELTVRDEVAFASALRWSGLVTDHDTWVLGAVDALLPHGGEQALAATVTARVDRGLRVLLLARADSDVGLRSVDGAARLPEQLEPVALVALADELRADVATTIGRLAAEGVAVKVISGDDPRTVAALAVQAGLPEQAPVRGDDLDAMDDPTLDAVVDATSVFGRVSPDHKVRIVDALRRQGHYVAMVGDGINDARALKTAQVGVAMRSGSAVTRDVADLVLTDDSFAALLPAQREGRRIVNGLAASLYVFLTRVATQGLVIITITMLGLGFPYSPTQLGMTLFTVGLPTLFLTWWARADRPQRHLLRSVARFVLPASLITAGFGIAIYAALYTRVYNGMAGGLTPEQVREDFESYTGLTYTDPDFATASATIAAQTGLTTFVSFASLLMILFIVPPHRLLAAWTEATGDWRPTIMVAVLMVVLAAVLFVPALSSYFGLTEAAAPVYELALPGLAVWFVALYACFRLDAYDRILGLGDLPKD